VTVGESWFERKAKSECFRFDNGRGKFGDVGFGTGCAVVWDSTRDGEMDGK
jgi:hypothetical protein